MGKYSYRIEEISSKDFSKGGELGEVRDFFSSLGSEGWELVGIVPTSKHEEQAGFTVKAFNTKSFLAIFKKETE